MTLASCTQSLAKRARTRRGRKRRAWSPRKISPSGWTTYPPPSTTLGCKTYFFRTCELRRSRAMNLSQVKDFYSVCRNETRNPQPGTSTYYVGLYWFPVIFVIGALGNSLNLIVLNSKGMKSKTNIFLSAMAATDLCFFFVMFFNNLSVFDPLATSQDFMRIYFKAKMTFVVLANWFSMASIW